MPWSNIRVKALLVTALIICAAAQAQSGYLQLSAPPFEIYYAQGDESVAQKSADILKAAAIEFQRHLPLGQERVLVFICPSFAHFNKLAGEYGRSMVGGFARSDSGIIIVKAPYLLPPDDDYEGMLRHELIHVLLARNTSPENVPRWFNEGVAMVISREIRWGGVFTLARMYAYNDVIPYWRLDFAFSPRGSEIEFGNAYAQAYSMTRFLQNRIGKDEFWALVHDLKNVPFGEALHARAGLTPGELYQLWLRSLWKFALLLWMMTGMTAFQLMALLVVLAYLRKYRRGKRIMRQWEEEERDEGGHEDLESEPEYDEYSEPDNEDDEDDR